MPEPVENTSTLIAALLKRMDEATREFCYSKIHRCVVTQAELNYIGSITIDSTLLRAAEILPHTKVEIVNITRKDAARIVTYVIEGTENSGVICLNGAAAHHFNPGDLAIIMAYERVPVSALPHRQHRVVQVNGEEGISPHATNTIKSIRTYTTPSLNELGQPENNRYGEIYPQGTSGNSKRKS